MQEDCNLSLQNLQLYSLIISPTSFALLVQFFALIVFACIIDKCKPSGYCALNDSHACNYGIWIGLFAWLLATLLMLVEIYRDALGVMRKTLAMVEFILDAAVAFLWYEGGLDKAPCVSGRVVYTYRLPRSSVLFENQDTVCPVV